MSIKKAQYSTEYVIVVGIGIAIIASFLVYAMLFYGSFASSSSANQMITIANSLAKEANYVAFQGEGSMQTFPITIPLLNPQHSFFCGNIIKLQTSAQLGIAQSAENISGMLPLSSGSYTAFVKAASNQIIVGLRFAISSIEQSYSISSNTLYYSLLFFNYSDKPVITTQPFNISLFSTSGVYITSATSSTLVSSPSQASGSLTLPSSPMSEYVVEIYPANSGDYSSTCITT